MSEMTIVTSEICILYKSAFDLMDPIDLSVNTKHLEWYWRNCKEAWVC